MKRDAITQAWKNLRSSGRLHDLCVFAGFVLVAFVFWCILALNEETQTDFEIKVKIVGVPDSVKFITDPPAAFHVNVRDRGTHLLRLRFLHEAEVKLDFNEFAQGGTFRVSSKALLAQSRALFRQGASVQIISSDSIVLPYTSMPGKMVPVRVLYDVVPTLGRVVSATPRSSVREVKVFSQRGIIDTISYVTTEPIIRRDVDDSFTVKVRLRPIKGVRFEPDETEVTIPIEPLENRNLQVPVRVVNVPAGYSVALFPDKVRINYLVPMNSGALSPQQFSVQADYRDIHSPADEYIKLHIVAAPHAARNTSLATDSVQFTVIKNAR